MSKSVTNELKIKKIKWSDKKSVQIILFDDNILIKERCIIMNKINKWINDLMTWYGGKKLP